MHRAIDAVTAGAFATLSRLRGKRIFHPTGVGFSATLTPARADSTGVALFDGPPRSVVVRLSRALGLPEPLPDVLGLAVRVPDAYGPGRHQDLLLVTSGAAPGTRHLLVPARGFLQRPYSSLLPYRVGGPLALVGAQPEGDAPGPGLAELRDRDRADLRFRLGLAGLSGPWTEHAALTLAERLDDRDVERLRLDPHNTGGGLQPAGVLNDLRRPAYRGSQQGRGAAPTPPAP